MEHEIIYQVVKKLVGAIDPVGETTADDKRFENLKTMTALIDKLLMDVDAVHYENKNNHQYSMKRASDFAKDFFDNINIKE